MREYELTISPAGFSELQTLIMKFENDPGVGVAAAPMKALHQMGILVPDDCLGAEVVVDREIITPVLAPKGAAPTHLSRPYKATILAVAELLRDDAYLALTVEEMVGRVMKGTGGAARPGEVQAIISRLKDEAGV